uniref:Interferon-induced protein 44-like n=1 Tax=Sinocyclocheilus anshuiensis TaxID=1608454 RepID=A0A671QAI7_9TELE
MSTVTSSLNRWQKKELCSFFNNANLSLLFKASVHGFNATTFHEKCNTQGPTVIVAYNKSGRVFGAFTSKSYAQTGQNVVDDKAFLFSFNDKEMKEDPLRVVSGNPQYAFTDNGPNFDSLVFLYNNTANAYSNPGTYQFDPQKIHGNDLQLTECEVYRVEDFEGLMEKPWRNFRPYYIKPSSSVTHVPFILCDTMGLEDGVNTGLDVDDFATILKGHIQDKYQFNPLMPIQPDSPHFHKSPGLKDKIHCVVFVIDISRVKLLSDKTIEKFVVFRKKANQLSIPQLVLLTKVDEACPLVAEDLKNVYQSHYINKMMQEISSQLGVSLSVVVPVKNYYQELEIDSQTDILLLNAVVQMLRAADGYFDDFYNPEERSE